jgi:hypothetical protein
LVSDIKVVISDTKAVTFGHKGCHTHHPKDVLEVRCQAERKAL